MAEPYFSRSQTDASPLPRQASASPPCVLLVGAGVVGRAILREHLRRELEVWLHDLSPAALQRAVEEALAAFPSLHTWAVPSRLPELSAVRLGFAASGSTEPEILIESIPENLELKRSFFTAAASILPSSCILASNTSNLRIAEIFDRTGSRNNCVGMHFFMPVGQRPLVELIAAPGTAPATLQRCGEHAGRLGKQTLVVRDSPGFVVNRLLAPYLNQALLLLGQGASPEGIARAAKRFGMPMSPLELIDLIGIRTAFDSGRVFWQSFPKRIDPAPILPGMIKAGRLGAEFGGGFFAPRDPGAREADDLSAASRAVHPDAMTVIERYQRGQREWSEEEALLALVLPMWIEAAEILVHRVVDSLEAIELGMRGGLGFRHSDGFFAFFDAQGADKLSAVFDRFADRASLAAPEYLREQLRSGVTPSEALQRYVAHSHDAAEAAAAGLPS